jgi:N-acetylornithine carbamoyltransferase
MKHFLTTADWSRPELEALLANAARLKANPIQTALHGRSIALLFLNPSMRTRTSFDLGMQQLGGIAIVLQPGKDAWGVEFDSGVTMDGDAEEHITEVAGVLSRYCDLIGIRAFPGFVDWTRDREDPVITAVARHSSVPVINMETIVHPCQELAMMMMLQERLGSVQNRKFLLTWTYHPRPLNTAVANSALMMATKFGMDVTLLCPGPEFRLDERFETLATRFAAESGGSYHLTHDVDEAYAGADVVYAKSWGALRHYGDPDGERPLREGHRDFIVDERKMALTNDAIFSHCLPLRRNIKATDAVMDSDACAVLDEAENRLHVQKAIMLELLGASGRIKENQ